MLSALNYIWRIVATGFCFTCFGLGGLLLSLTIFPLINCIPAPEGWHEKKARRLIFNSFRLFVWLMQFVGVLRVTVEGREKLNNAGIEGALIIANHPTLIDVVVLVSLLPEVDCIVKEALWKNPFLAGVVKAANYISNTSDPEHLLQQCRQTLSGGGNIIVFPEGTRSVPEKPLRFQRGAANLAVRSSSNMVPVTITCTPPSLMKGQKWYQVPRHSKVNLHLQVGEVIAIDPFLQQANSDALASRQLTDFLQTAFRKELVANE